MTPRVIGLCGPEGAGKTTAGKILAETYDGQVRPFAEPLKQMLLALGVPKRNLYGTPAEKLEPVSLLGGKTGRHAAQTLGTEWGRQQHDEELWVRAWRLRIEGEVAPVIADDLRFLNEAAAVRSLGGEIICVVRSLKDFDRKPKHASEDFAAVKAKWVLLNDGSVEALRASIFGMFGDPESSGKDTSPLPAFMSAAPG